MDADGPYSVDCKTASVTLASQTLLNEFRCLKRAAQYWSDYQGTRRVSPADEEETES